MVSELASEQTTAAAPAGHHGQQPKQQPRPQVEHGATASRPTRACPECSGHRYWRDAYRRLHCETCEPPPRPSFARAWGAIDEASGEFVAEEPPALDAFGEPAATTPNPQAPSSAPCNPQARAPYDPLLGTPDEWEESVNPKTGQRVLTRNERLSVLRAGREFSGVRIVQVWDPPPAPEESAGKRLARLAREERAAAVREASDDHEDPATDPEI